MAPSIAFFIAAGAVAQSPSTGNTSPWTGGGPPSNPDPTKFPSPPPTQQPLPTRPPSPPSRPSPEQPLPTRPGRPDRPVVIYPSRPNHVHVYGEYSWDHWGYQNTSRRYYDSMGNAYTIEQRCTRPYPTRGWSYDGSCWYRYIRVGSGLSFGGFGPDPSINYYGVSPNVSNGPYTQYVGSDGRTYISVPVDPSTATPAAPPTAYDNALEAVRARQTAQAIKELHKYAKDLAADSAASPDHRAERLLAVMYLENAEFSEAMSRLSLAYRRLPTLANEPIDAADLGISSARLRHLVVKAVRYANRMNTGSSWLMVTVLMQAEGRTDLALANLAKAEAVGLEKKIVEPMRVALSPSASSADPAAAPPASAAPVPSPVPAPAPAPAEASPAEKTPATTERRE